MAELPKRAFQFKESPKIEDIIKTLKEAKSLGYTKVKPFMVEGDYNHEKMDCEKLLRVYLF